MKKIFCKVCGNSKEVKDNNTTAKYCSMACFAQSKVGKRAKRKTIFCAYCGSPKEVYASDNRTKYCSKACKYAAVRGKSRPDSYKLQMAGKLSNIKNVYKSGYIHLSRLNKDIWFRSSYEETALQLFDEIVMIRQLDAEKVFIPYIKDDNTKHFYVMDYTLYLSNGNKVLVEIKPKNRMTDRVNVLKFAAAKQYAEENNVTFIVLNKEHLLDSNSVETTLLKATSMAKATNRNVEDIVQPIQKCVESSRNDSIALEATRS